MDPEDLSVEPDGSDEITEEIEEDMVDTEIEGGGASDDAPEDLPGWDELGPESPSQAPSEAQASDDTASTGEAETPRQEPETESPSQTEAPASNDSASVGEVETPWQETKATKREFLGLIGFLCLVFLAIAGNVFFGTDPNEITDEPAKHKKEPVEVEMGQR